MNDRVDPLRFLTVDVVSGAGRVVSVEAGDRLRVRCGGEVVEMARAVSCLVAPQAGDRVAWCVDDGDDGHNEIGDDGPRHWVTAVLSRDAAVAATLQLPADATLQSTGRLRIEADEVQVRGRHVALIFETAETVGACWQGVIGAMRWTGTTLSAVVDRMTTVAKTRQQFTEGSDLVQAGTLDLRSDGLATVHAEHLLIEAGRLVKTRAPQIHMG